MADEYSAMHDAEGSNLVIDSLALECGVELQQVNVTYRTWGTLNTTGDNCVFVAHALTGNAAVDAWWGPLLGSGKAMDTDKYFIVCANVLGSCYGSTGPHSEVPPSGTPWVAGGAGGANLGMGDRADYLAGVAHAAASPPAPDSGMLHRRVWMGPIHEGDVRSEQPLERGSRHEGVAGYAGVPSHP